jgi:hypothetical protein
MEGMVVYIDFEIFLRRGPAFQPGSDIAYVHGPKKALLYGKRST